MSSVTLPVLRLPWVTLYIQKLINDLWGFQFLPYQKKDSHHASYLWFNTKKPKQKNNNNKVRYLKNLNTTQTNVS